MQKFIFILKIVVCIFAVIGLGFVVVYFAVKFHFTNTAGIIDSQNDYFKQAAVTSDSITEATTCTLIAGNDISRPDILTIFSVYQTNNSISLVNRMASTLYLELLNNPGFKPFFDRCIAQNQTLSISDIENKLDAQSANTAYTWATGDEWQTLQAALIKDSPAINKAAADSNSNSRLIVSSLIVEQLRLFYSDREIFKEVFSPLKILGVQSQFSWGVMGIKPDTAIAIENNLNDSTSAFYPGAQYAHLLDFTTTDHDTERFNRLTDQHNHYYSYLYAGIYMKEIETQWQKAGFDISNRPEILSTLFNIGFAGSKPTANPEVGGAQIDINGRTYSFGSLANEFYYSGLLANYFPYN